MGTLASKVALVTGGASGLGKAIAQRFQSDGAIVVITDIQAEHGRHTAAELGIKYLEHDVSDEVQWLKVVRQIEEWYGRLDILVNNAGILGPKDASNPENTRLADWKNIFAANVEGVFLGCKTAIPLMRKSEGGSIINMSSVAGLAATPYATAYGASKAAVRQLTKSVAQHCAQERTNIRCNSVHPGDVRTPMLERSMQEVARVRGIPFDEVVTERRANIPLGDFTLPEDIAAAVSFLASDEARHITGVKLVVDSGSTSCNTYHLFSKKAGMTRTTASNS